MVLKAVKMCIYPNSVQRNCLIQTFGCARFVWNQMLNIQIERRKNNPEAKFVNAFGMNNLLKRLKEEYPWLKQAESTALQSTNRNLADAFQRFLKDKISFHASSQESMRRAITRNVLTITLRCLN